MAPSLSDGPQPLPLASRNRGDLDALVKASLLKHLERCGLKFEVVATLMGITRQQLAQQLLPGGHISVTRLLCLAEDPDGARLVQAVWFDIGEHIGIHGTDAVVEELKRFQGRIGWLADRIQVRMARAELRDIEQQRRRA